MEKVEKVQSFNIQSDCETTSKREQTYPVCLHAVENYEKVKSANKQNDYETISKKSIDKNKTTLFCVFCKSD